MSDGADADSAGTILTVYTNNGTHRQVRSLRRLYNTARWRRLRLDQLARDPLCAICTQAGRITPATTCDHVVPHRGDETLFWSGPFQSLCSSCHSHDKQVEEHGGAAYHGTADALGWPTDPRHPVNSRVAQLKRSAF